MTDGPPKFLVVEINGNEEAVNLVQILLNNGHSRLMLLDNLAKHPTLTSKKEEPEKVEPIVDKPSTSALKTPKEEEEEPIIDDEIAPDWIAQLAKNPPEIVPIDVDLDFIESYLRSNGTDQLPDSPPKKKSKLEKSEDPDYHECQMCKVQVKAPRSGRWNLQMHVVALHSRHKMYKCSECDFEDYRKTTMRKHGNSVHQKDITPVNIITPEKRVEWDLVMGQCFPELAHRTGFLNELKL